MKDSLSYPHRKRVFHRIGLVIHMPDGLRHRIAGTLFNRNRGLRGPVWPLLSWLYLA